MKHTNLFKKISLVAVLFTMLSGNAAFAIEKVEAKNDVELIYNGQEEGNASFNLNLNDNVSASGYLVEIRDEFGNTLYRGNAKPGATKFLVQGYEGDGDVRFLVTNLDTKKTTTYTVRKENTVITQTVIKMS